MISAQPDPEAVAETENTENEVAATVNEAEPQQIAEAEAAKEAAAALEAAKVEGLEYRLRQQQPSTQAIPMLPARFMNNPSKPFRLKA